ncbi:MAG: hypothetical protein ABIK85_06940 [Candidatus Eisenbacteria bacterium]
MTRQRGLIPAVLSLLAALTFMLALQATVSGCASEANRGYPTGGRGGVMQMPQGPSVYEIITQLELEPEQLPAVRAVLEAAEDEREEIFAAMPSGTGGRPDPSMMDDIRAGMDDLKERTEDRLSELLTLEQMTEYREMLRKAELQREQMRSLMSGGRGGGRSGGGKR